MSQRERLLGIVAGAAVVLLIGTQLVDWTIISPLQELHRDLRNADVRRAQLQSELEIKANARKEWAELTSQTLHQDPDKAQIRFVDDLRTLLEQHGLTEDLSIKPLKAIPDRKTDMTQVRVSIYTKGTLESLMAFMTDFYRRNYLARLDSISLTKDTSGRRGGSSSGRGSRRASRRSSDESEPLLKLSMTATTLVLPPLKGIPHRRMAEIEVLDRGRLPQPPETYDVVVDANIFEEYVPPPPKPVTPTKPVKEPPKVAERDPEPVTPRPAPKPREESRVVVGTTSKFGTRIAYVMDDDDRMIPPEEVFVNDEIDDGQVVLIHRKGIVVRVVDERGSGEPEYYFYPLGDRFEYRVEFDPRAYPEVARELEIALKP